MQIIELLYKIVGTPKSSENYLKLKEYFTQNNMVELSEAFDHLLKVKYASTHSNPPEQDKS
jgi:hypothetical protein